MKFAISIPTSTGKFDFSLKTGESAIFVGANGSGKTRLAVYLEAKLSSMAHRIAAHRALNLDPSVPKIREIDALRGLQLGHSDPVVEITHRSGNRWHEKEATHLLDDFNFVVQSLFAEQTNRALNTHTRRRAGNVEMPIATKFEKLIGIWNGLIPHRRLIISGDDIQVCDPDASRAYSASDMSDGERAIFYLIGQTLLASPDSLIIFDEPELHVHRSIMGKLWDALESARQDCAFVFITHDLEFAASRVGQKFVLHGYSAIPQWCIEPVPIETGFDEETVTRILGSRKPVLFIEGANTSLDLAIYRNCFQDWTIIPKGSCAEVIHSVVTLRQAMPNFTRISCAGIVDADDYDVEDATSLATQGIAILPVSEIENLILLPTVSREIAANEGFSGEELEAKLASLREAIFNTLNSESAVDAVVMRYCQRRIDRFLKKADMSKARNVENLREIYLKLTNSFDVMEVADRAKQRIQDALKRSDLISLLKCYDNKGLFAICASQLKGTHRTAFENWLVRILSSDSIPRISEAIRTALPPIHSVEAQ